MTVVLTSLAGAFIFVFAMRWAERAPNWPTQLGWVLVAVALPFAAIAHGVLSRMGHLVVVVR